MKISFITTIKGSPWGGSEELWCLAALEAIKDGHEVSVFVYEWDDDPQKIKVLRSKGAEINKRSRSFYFFQRTILKILESFGIRQPFFLNPYKRILTINPDRIVITDGIYYTVNDIWLTNILKNFKGRYLIISQGNGSYNSPDNRGEAIRIFRESKYIAFVAEHNKNLTFHQLAKVIPNNFIIQNPVNLDDFKALPFPDYSDGLVHCAVVGRFFVSDKGQDIIIEMMADEFWRKSNVIVHMYGGGSDMDYLKNLIEYYSVHDKVIIEKYTDIYSIWKKCHCLLMPSILEGTPLTLLEALVLGRICVVTKVGGNEEWIVDGVNGYLVDAPTKGLFSKKFKQALSEIDQWKSISTEAHKSAMVKLDKNPGKTLLRKVIE